MLLPTLSHPSFACNGAPAKVFAYSQKALGLQLILDAAPCRALGTRACLSGNAPRNKLLSEVCYRGHRRGGIVLLVWARGGIVGKTVVEHVQRKLPLCPLDRLPRRAVVPGDGLDQEGGRRLGLTGVGIEQVDDLEGDIEPQAILAVLGLLQLD